MLRLLRILGANLGSLAYMLGIRRAVVEENLRKAYPDSPSSDLSKLAIGAYRNLGIVFLEFVYLRFASRQAILKGLQINNLDEISKNRSNGIGAILLSGHLGNWEWLAMGCGLRVQQPLEVVIKNQKSSFAERFLNRMRTRFGNRMINAGNVRGIFRSLGEGKYLAILGDQASPSESVRVPFFGRSVPTYEGPARLALHTGAPIFLLQPVTRTACGYDCTFHQVQHSDLAGVTDETVRELTARHTALLERLIRERPELWLWHHRRWKYAEG